MFKLSYLYVPSIMLYVCVILILDIDVQIV